MKVPNSLKQMTKYEKAVAYINQVDGESTQAELGGMMDNIVYLITDIGDLRLHEEEVNAMAQNYDLLNA